MIQCKVDRKDIPVRKTNPGGTIEQINCHMFHNFHDLLLLLQMQAELGDWR